MKARSLSLFLAIATMCAGILPISSASAAITDELQVGDLITSEQTQAVYYFGPDGRRYVFPNEKTYFTWYSDFSTVKIIDHNKLQALPLGRSNVTYRPGVKMVKITTDPRTYAVEHGSILRHVDSEAVAIALYGTNWNQKIEDVPDAFFSNYKVGNPILSASDYSPSAQLSLSPTIAIDKSFEENIATVTIGNVSQGFVPGTITVKAGTRITWVNRDIANHTVTGDAFDSGSLVPDETYSLTFSDVGTFDYHCSLHPTMMGTIIVE